MPPKTFEEVTISPTSTFSFYYLTLVDHILYFSWSIGIFYTFIVHNFFSLLDLCLVPSYQLSRVSQCSSKTFISLPLCLSTFCLSPSLHRSEHTPFTFSFRAGVLAVAFIFTHEVHVVTSRSHFPVVFVSWLLWPEDSGYSWENPTVTGCLFLQGRFTFSLSGCQKVFSISSRSADFVFVVIFQAFLVAWTQCFFCFSLYWLIPYSFIYFSVLFAVFVFWDTS